MCWQLCRTGNRRQGLRGADDGAFSNDCRRAKAGFAEWFDLGEAALTAQIDARISPDTGT